MPKKFRPGALPDAGGHIHHDQYYKPLEDRGEPSLPPKEIVLASAEIEVLIDTQPVYSSISRWLSVLEQNTTGANIHDLGNIKNALYQTRDILKDQSFVADATFEEMKKGNEVEVELYEVIVESLQKIKKILSVFTI